MKSLQTATFPNRIHPLGFIKANALLLLICALGVGLRIYNLGAESLWVDEGYSARIAQLFFTRIMHELLLDTHPPVYFFCLHVWFSLFGGSEIALRSFSVLTGGISILFSYAIGRQLFNKAIGLVAALLISLNAYQIACSQEIRMYSLLFCLAAASSYFFILSMNTGRFWAKAAYFIATVLLLYTHIHGSFVLFAQGITVLSLFIVNRSKMPEKFRGILVLQILSGIVFLPWIFVVKLQLIGRMESWIPVPTIAALFGTFEEFSGSYYTEIVFFALLVIAFLSRNILMKIPVVRNFFNKGVLRDEYTSLPVLFLTIWLCTAIFLPFLISITVMPIYKTKYVVAVLLPFVLLTISGIMAISNKWIKVAIVLAVVTLSFFNIKTYFSGTHKDQWRDAVRYIEERAQPGDVLIFNAGFNLENAYNYYSKRHDLIKIPFPEKSALINCPVDENNIHELDSIIGRYIHIWIIASQNKDPMELIAQRMNLQYNFLAKQYFRGVGIFVFELRD